MPAAHASSCKLIKQTPCSTGFIYCRSAVVLYAWVYAPLRAVAPLPLERALHSALNPSAASLHTAAAHAPWLPIAHNRIHTMRTPSHGDSCKAFAASCSRGQHAGLACSANTRMDSSCTTTPTHGRPQRAVLGTIPAAQLCTHILHPATADLQALDPAGNCGHRRMSNGQSNASS